MALMLFKKGSRRLVRVTNDNEKRCFEARPMMMSLRNESQEKTNNVENEKRKKS